MEDKKNKKPRKREPEPQYPEINYLQDYGPSQEPVYRKGSRATEMGLRLGVITEEGTED